jgi:hypothetical protein
MSHFRVLVVGPESLRELQDVLEPYSEHIKFPPYIKFTREDKYAERKRSIKMLKKLLNERNHWMHDGYDPKIHGPIEPWKKVEIAAKLKVLQDMSGEEYFYNETKYYDLSSQNTQGEPISTYNPNSRWSNWEYYNSLLIKGLGLLRPSAKKKDVDWARMSQYGGEQAIVDWCRMFNSIDDPRCDASTRTLLYDYWQGESKLMYMERKELFMTHAYILNGRWHERGKVGWWGDTSEEMDRDKWIAKYKKMLTQVKPNTVLHTLDCHI